MCVSPSEDMSPYCSAHDEWLIMKLCMYVDSGTMMPTMCQILVVTQLNLRNVFSIIYAVLWTWRSIAAAVATRPREDCSSMEGHTSLSTALVYNFYVSCINYNMRMHIGIFRKPMWHLLEVFLSTITEKNNLMIKM